MSGHVYIAAQFSETFIECLNSLSEHLLSLRLICNIIIMVMIYKW